jgi:hypothetical protein
MEKLVSDLSVQGDLIKTKDEQITNLLTHRSGGKHGDEEDLRWRFPSLARCREELLDPPDLGLMTAVNRDVFLEN